MGLDLAHFLLGIEIGHPRDRIRADTQMRCQAPFGTVTKSL